MRSFIEDCGAGVPVVVEVRERGGTAPLRHLFDRPAILIGGGPRSDLRLEHPDVSRRHAYIQVIGGRPFCVDLESRTGTHPERGSGIGWVDPGRPIRVGPYLVEIAPGTGGGDGGGPAPADHPGPLAGEVAWTDACPGATLEVRRRGGNEATIRLGRTLTLIGRSRRCKIRLGSPEDSRFAAALLRTPGGVWLVDLRATGRLTVNGEPTEGARLEEGDRLEIGRYVARLRYDRPASGPVRAPLKVVGGEPFLPIAFGSPSGAERPAADLLPILDQFSRMQQQTNDHFDRVIVMVSELFGSMHKEMVDLVREELEEIRQLTAGAQARGDSASGDDGPPPAGEVPGRPRDPMEIHAFVSERLAAFERERQGHWNTISKVLHTLVRSH